MSDLPRPRRTPGQMQPSGTSPSSAVPEHSRPVRPADQYASETEEYTVPPQAYTEIPYHSDVPDEDLNDYETRVIPQSAMQQSVYRQQVPRQGSSQQRQQAPRQGSSQQRQPAPRQGSSQQRQQAPRQRSSQQRQQAPRQGSSRQRQQVPRQQKQRPAVSHPRRCRTGCFGRLVRTVLVFVVIVFALYSAVSLALISKLEKVPKGARTVTSGTLHSMYTKSILLIGTDSRDLSAERGRSDSMMLFTMNSRTGDVYLTSFMRDTWVEIPGYGGDKLNAAYSYGGAELLMDTIEQNFSVRIDDYVCVSFTGFASVIDALGGVKLEVSDEEAEEINNILRNEVNELMGDDPGADLLEKGGELLLNGKQALSFARIRYVGNADFERTSRQREVMNQILHNAQTRLVSAVPDLISSAMPHFSTNMTTGELYLFSLRMPFALVYDMQQQQIPADGTWSPETIDGQSVLQVDFDQNINLLHETVFASVKPAKE